MSVADIGSAEALLFVAFTVGPLLALLTASVASLRIIYRLERKWLLLLVLVMGLMTQHQILEGVEFVRTGGASLTPVQETFETAANLTLAGATYYVLSFARDQRRLAEQFERSKDRYNRLVENAPSPILVVTDGAAVYHNPMATAFFGELGVQDPDGVAFLSLVHSEDRERVRRELDVAAGGGDTMALSETRFVNEGATRMARGMVASVVYEDEDALQIVLQDITEREEFEEQLDTTFQNTNDAILIVDVAADEILECNREACEMLGYDRDEVLGLAVSEIHPGEMDRLRQFADAATDGGARTDALSCRRRDGQQVPAEISGASIWFRGRECLLAVVRDISERQRQERRIKVLDRVLRHNLRNDMNLVMGNAQLLETDVSDPELADAAATIRETAAELVEMGDSLRRVQSTIDRDTDRDPRTDAARLVETTAQRFCDRYPNAEIETSVPEQLAIQADDRLCIALEQVVENAIVHNGDDPWVGIDLIEEEGWARLSIADDGPGLPEAERTALSTNRITQIEHGSGMGLWIAVWVTEAFGGELTIEDPQAGGTAVTLRLKLAPASD
jgi:PAS domain S-box-containing protein